MYNGLFNLIIKFNFLRKILIKITNKNQLESITLRKIYKKIYNIDVGMYSYGCFNFPDIPINTKIGRYCSFGPGIKIFNANHPSEYIFLHPYMYNVALGMVKEEPFTRTKLEIGNDVWIGANTIILPSVKNIGNGVIIGAGTIVTKDIPDFAIVVGNPGKIIKYRFSKETQNLIIKYSLYEIDKIKFYKNIKKFYDEKSFITFLKKENNNEE